ncbi:hypothetical protein ACFE04_020738 [Oxalis oulophora]
MSLFVRSFSDDSPLASFTSRAIYDEIEVVKIKYGRLNTIVMNAMMEACVRCRDVDLAVKVFHDMSQPDSCGVDTVTYGILLKSSYMNQFMPNFNDSRTIPFMCPFMSLMNPTGTSAMPLMNYMRAPSILLANHLTTPSTKQIFIDKVTHHLSFKNPESYNQANARKISLKPPPFDAYPVCVYKEAAAPTLDFPTCRNLKRSVGTSG